MQKRVCEHIIRSIQSEAERMKEDWKSKLGKLVKPEEQDKSQEGEDDQEQSSPDTYCFELVSMVMGLCQSEVGRVFLAEQADLIRDLLVLLHVSTNRIQLQVTILYIDTSCTHILTYVYTCEHMHILHARTHNACTPTTHVRTTHTHTHTHTRTHARTTSHIHTHTHTHTTVFHIFFYRWLHCWRRSSQS